MRKVVVVCFFVVLLIPGWGFSQVEDEPTRARVVQGESEGELIPLEEEVVEIEEFEPLPPKPIEVLTVVRGPEGRVVLLFSEPIPIGEYSGAFTIIKVAVAAEAIDGDRVEELRLGDEVLGLALSVPGYILDSKREYIVLMKNFTYANRPLESSFFVLEFPSGLIVKREGERIFEISYNTMADMGSVVLKKNGDVLKKFEDYKLTAVEMGLPASAGGDILLRLELLDLPRASDRYTLGVRDAGGNIITTELAGLWGKYVESEEDRLFLTSEISVSKQKGEDTAFMLDVLGRYELGGSIFRYFPVASIKTASQFIGNPNSLNFGFGVKYIWGFTASSHLFAQGIAKVESDDHWRQVNGVGDFTLLYYDSRLNYSGDKFSMVFKPRAGVELGAKVKMLEEGEVGKLLRPKAAADIELRYKLSEKTALIFKGNGQLRYPLFEERDVDISVESSALQSFSRKLKYYFKGKVGLELFNFYIVGFDLEWGELPPTYHTVKKYGISYSVDF